MGQAAVDLPDPLEAQAPANAAGVDDLLAQLAGDEIDRLLADGDEAASVADVAAPVSDRAAPTADVNAEPAGDPSPNGSGSAAGEFNPSGAEPIPTGAEDAGTDPAPGDAAVDEPARDPLAAILNSPVEKPSSNDSAGEDAPGSGGLLPPGAVEQVLAEDAAAQADSARSADATSFAGDFATTAAERSALEAQSPNPPDGGDPADAPLSVAEAVPSSHALPPYLRPLEWLSAPLAACPDSVRDGIGKIAIVTLVNAVAVLIYVLLLRK